MRSHWVYYKLMIKDGYLVDANWTIVKSAQIKPKELNKRDVSSIQEEDNKMKMYKFHYSQKPTPIHLIL